jgi:hypothetical protein
VLACAGHDLSGALQALFTYLRMIERQAPSPHVTGALTAAQRLRDEVLGLRQAAEPAPAATGGSVDLHELVRDVRGVDPTRLRVILHGPDARVVGNAGALGQALTGLVRAVAASLPDAAPVHVTLSAGERDVRVLVGDVGDDGDDGDDADHADHADPIAFDPLLAHAGERTGLEPLLAAIALEGHGGALLRGGAPGRWRWEAVVPRSPR